MARAAASNRKELTNSKSAQPVTNNKVDNLAANPKRNNHKTSRIHQREPPVKHNKADNTKVSLQPNNRHTPWRNAQPVTNNKVDNPAASPKSIRCPTNRTQLSAQLPSSMARAAASNRKELTNSKSAQPVTSNRVDNLAANLKCNSHKPNRIHPSDPLANNNKAVTARADHNMSLRSELPPAKAKARDRVNLELTANKEKSVQPLATNKHHRLAAMHRVPQTLPNLQDCRNAFKSLFRRFVLFPSLILIVLTK